MSVPPRAARIDAGWAEQKAVRDTMRFLHVHGVGTSRTFIIARRSPCRPEPERAVPLDEAR